MQKHSAEITDFHVAPLVSSEKGQSRHQWFIEFLQEPRELSKFETDLDCALQNQNTYYKDLVDGSILSKLEIIKIKKNGFNDYMKSVGKLGGQNKIPRLSNDRAVAEKLIKFRV